MKKSTVFVLFLTLFFGTVVSAQTATISFSPTEVIQGQPIMIQVNGNISSVKKVTFDGKSLGLFTYKNKPTALVGIDLKKKPGSYEAIVEFFAMQTILFFFQKTSSGLKVSCLVFKSFC